MQYKVVIDNEEMYRGELSSDMKYSGRIEETIREDCGLSRDRYMAITLYNIDGFVVLVMNSIEWDDQDHTMF